MFLLGDQDSPSYLVDAIDVAVTDTGLRPSRFAPDSVVVVVETVDVISDDVYGT